MKRLRRAVVARRSLVGPGPIEGSVHGGELVPTAAHRLEVVGRREVGDVPPEASALHVRGAEVQPCPDAGFDELRESLREATEASRSGISREG